MRSRRAGIVRRSLTVGRTFVAAFIACIAIVLSNAAGEALAQAPHSEGVGAFAEATKFTVKIRTKIEYPHIRDGRGVFSGAGFLVDRTRGWIATNAHVAGRNPSKIEVRFKGHEYVPASPLFIDPYIDFALIQISPGSVPISAGQASIDCGTHPGLGSAVGAFGHPHGLDYSGTRGIVSGRQYKFWRDWIQTDAPINHGNSGGPLISLETGKVVGINTGILDKKVSEGIGFAIPAPLFCSIINRIERGLDPSPPIIPVELSLDHESDKGINVMRVYSKAGQSWALREGDRIIAIMPGDAEGSKPIPLETPGQLIAELRQVNLPNVSLVVMRQKKPINVSVSISRMAKLLQQKYLFVSGATIGNRTMRDDEAHNPSGLLLVHDVRDESEAYLAGLKSYDLIQSIDGRSFRTVSELQIHLSSLGSRKSTFNIFRRRSSFNSRSTYLLIKLRIEGLKLVAPPKT